MWTFLYDYGLFLAKTITIVVAIVLIVSAVVHLIRRGGSITSPPGIKVKKLNDKFDAMERTLKSYLLSDAEWKQMVKDEKKKEKAKKKQEKKSGGEQKARKRVFVLDFEGDITATAVESLREEISAILTVARPETDEVVVRLESFGGTVNGYGLGASQLQRIRERKIPLTVVVDKIAASGGYKMACVADKLVAAPYAVVGSIGVVAEFPNIHRLLKKHDIDYEMITAGEFKRTLTPFGENTPRAREKFTEQLTDIHQLFKQHVQEFRPNVEIDKVATGESWYGVRARELQLVDELQTSDDLLMSKRKDADILQVTYQEKPNVTARISYSLNKIFKRMIYALWEAAEETKIR